MKLKHLILLILFLTLGLVLSACTGNTGVASSWPGLTVDETYAYLAFNQHIFAVDLANGQEAWRFPEEANNKISFYARPALSPDGQLLAGGFDNKLYSLDPASGKENWSFTGAANRYIGTPLVSEQGFFAPNADDHLYAVDPSGELRWSFKTQGAQWAMPSSDPECNCIYVPSMDHHLYSVNAQTGEQNWITEELGGALVGTPAYGDEGLLYVGTFKSEMLAIKAGTGEIVWRVPTKGWVWAGPILREGVLYFGDLSGTFYAMDQKNGDILWEVSPDGPISESPLVTENGIYFSTKAGTLYALDFQGKTLWENTIGGKLYTSPAAAGDMILVAPVGIDDQLIALDTAGNQKWTFTPEKK